MAETTDYVDISPDVGGSRGKKTTVLQETEWRQVLDNPNRLTKEGVEEKLRIWRSSTNKHAVIKYETMLARCKTLDPSGKTPDGKIILARDANGVPSWVKDDDSAPKKPKFETKTKEVN